MQAAMLRPRNWFWSGEEPEWIVVAVVAVALILGGIQAVPSSTREKGGWNSTLPRYVGQTSTPTWPVET